MFYAAIPLYLHATCDFPPSPQKEEEEEEAQRVQERGADVGNSLVIARGGERTPRPALLPRHRFTHKQINKQKK